MNSVCCETCQKSLKCPPHLQGKRVRCPRCSSVFVVPTSQLNQQVLTATVEQVMRSLSEAERTNLFKVYAALSEGGITRGNIARHFLDVLNAQSLLKVNSSVLCSLTIRVLREELPEHAQAAIPILLRLLKEITFAKLATPETNHYAWVIEEAAKLTSELGAEGRPLVAALIRVMEAADEASYSSSYLSYAERGRASEPEPQRWRQLYGLGAMRHLSCWP